MARGVRFTKAERELLLELLNVPDTFGKPARKKIAAGIRVKLEASQAPQVKSKGLAVAVAVEAFREVLGNRLVLPPNPTAGWYAQQGNRLGILGLSRQDCVSVARAAAAEWKGLIKAESLVRQADTLLHSAQLSVPGTEQTTEYNDLDEL